MINSKNIFENIRIDDLNHQKKVSIDSSLSVYYGRTIDNKLRLSFLSKVVPPIISSTRMITVYQVSEGNKYYWTCFDLTDLKASSIYFHICDDLLLSIVAEKDEEIAIKKIKKRFDLWKRVLNKPVKNEMSIEEAKGLFGELYFLDKYMFDKYGIDQSISAWTGPNGYPKDFSINGTWYEVKTTGINSNKIKINSIGQLDSDNDGYLVILKVENMSEEYNDGYSSLDEIINDVFNKVDNMDVKDLFIEKLSTKGYLTSNFNLPYRFRFVSMSIYIVDGSFPRIYSNLIKFEEIEDVEYTLRISSLEKFKIC